MCEKTLVVAFPGLRVQCPGARAQTNAVICDISIWNRETCSRRGTDLYFRRCLSHRRRDSAYTPNRGKPINPRTDAPKDTIARGPLSAVLVTASRSGVRLQQRSPAPRLIPGERRGVCHQKLWGQIGPMGSGGRRGSRRLRRTVCADDTDGKVGDSLETTRERSPTVPSPLPPPRYPAAPCGISRSQSRPSRPSPSGGKSDGGVVGEVTRLVGTPIHAHSLVVGRRRNGSRETPPSSLCPACSTTLPAARVASGGTDTTSHGWRGEIAYVLPSTSREHQRGNCFCRASVSPLALRNV